jgi:hypothetical protein
MAGKPLLTSVIVLKLLGLFCVSRLLELGLIASNWRFAVELI